MERILEIRTDEDSSPEPPVSEEGRRRAEENAEFIRQMNAWVEKHGLPLEEYRMF